MGTSIDTAESVDSEESSALSEPADGFRVNGSDCLTEVFVGQEERGATFKSKVCTESIQLGRILRQNVVLESMHRDRKANGGKMAMRGEQFVEFGRVEEAGVSQSSQSVLHASFADGEAVGVGEKVKLDQPDDVIKTTMTELDLARQVLRRDSLTLNPMLHVEQLSQLSGRNRRAVSNFLDYGKRGRVSDHDSSAA